ncbi:hypothetical protein ES703_65743 [subsurface metagenome]|jgi:hypothetical protein
MTEPNDTDKKDWHSASHLTDFHILITEAQKKEVVKHCDRYQKSQGKFVREALNYLLGFYHNLEQDEVKKR